MAQPFNPQNVNLTDVDPVKVICYLNSLGDEPEDQNTKLGLRIGAIFLLLLFSILGSIAPLLLKGWGRDKDIVPEWVYDFTLQFGAGVILATAFVHLLPSAYEEIGSDSCVGQTGKWSDYPWVPAIILTAVVFMFLLHTGAQQYVSSKYGNSLKPASTADATDQKQRMPETPFITGQQHPSLFSANRPQSWEDSLEDVLFSPSVKSLQSLHLPPAELPLPPLRTSSGRSQDSLVKDADQEKQEEGDTAATHRFPQQLATFCILEFGVLFHSAIIGMNLGTNSSSGLVTLLVALIFHQTFEGLGVGARLAEIDFPKRWNWLKWLFCALYGSITSFAIAVGLGVRHSYDPESFTASLVSGVLDSASCGILIYTGLVELLAKDFILNQEKKTDKKLFSMLVFVLLGVLLMAVLAKWV